MDLQIIKTINGDDEYVLLPLKIYRMLQEQIDKKIEEEKVVVPYRRENPIVSERRKAHLNQKQLALKMKTSQAYISKIENREYVSDQLLKKVKEAIAKEEPKKQEIPQPKGSHINPNINSIWLQKGINKRRIY